MRARLQRLLLDQALARTAPNSRRGAGATIQRQGTVISTVRRLLLLAIAVFTLSTAVIHIAYAFPTMMFIASGVGYLVLLAAFFTPALRSVRSWVGLALALFAIGNIAAWYATGARIPLAYVDKAFEAALLGALAAYVLVARRPSPMPVRVTPARRDR